MTRSKPSPRTTPSQDIEAIDALFRVGGLVRRRTGKPAGITRQLRMERAQPEELLQPSPAPRIAPNGVHYLPVAAWDKFDWLWHGFSTRKGGLSRAYCPEGAQGELNLGFTASDDRDAVLGNRRLFAEAVTGSAAMPLVTLRQFHSNLLVVAGREDASRPQPWKGDGVITDQPGILLAVQTADCIPVLVADRKRKVIGAFHAGWRGTVKRIVETGVGRMRIQFGSRPEDLIAAIGPGNGACSYAVGEDVLSEFESQFTYARELFCEVFDSDPVRTRYPMLFLTQRAPGHSPIGPSLHVDLIQANRRQLLDAGLKPASIQVIGGCTQCEPELFFSHRGSRGHAGRMLSVIGIRPKVA